MWTGTPYLDRLFAESFGMSELIAALQEICDETVYYKKEYMYIML